MSAGLSDTAASPVASRPAVRAERLLIPAAFATTAGNSFQITAAAILVFRAEESTLAVGWLFIAVAIPQVLLSAFFGHLADKVDRRRLCIAADLTSTATALALPVWLWLGGPANLGSYLAHFLLACVTALFMPASNALIKERIRDERIGQFNANFEMATNAGMLLSSAAAGFLVLYFGAIPLFVVNSATFLFSALCVFLLGSRPASLPEAAAAPVDDNAAAVDVPTACSDERPPLLLLGLLYAVGNVIVVVSNTILTVLILDAFNAGPGLIGVVDALAGIGFLVSAALYTWTSGKVHNLWLALFGGVGSCLMIALEPISVVVLMIVIPISGFCFAQGRIAARTLLMRSVPVDRAGRVFGATNAFGLGLSVVAAVALSVLADHAGVGYAFWGLALLVGGTVVVTVALLAGRLRPGGKAAVASAAAPVVNTPVTGGRR